MADTSNTKKGTLSLSISKEVNKGGVVGTTDSKIRQSFSHGKSKVVAVEIKKKRTRVNPADKLSAAYKDSDLTGDEMLTRLNIVRNALNDEKEQMEKRLRKEQEYARLREENEQMERAARLKQEQEAQNAAEQECNESPADVVAADSGDSVTESKEVESEEPSKVEAKSDVDDGKEQKRDRGESSAPTSTESRHRASSHHNRRDEQAESADDDIMQQSPGGRRGSAIKRNIKELRGKYAAHSGRISIYNALDEEQERVRTSSSRGQKHKNSAKSHLDEIKVVKEVILPETISIQELSNRIAVSTATVVKSLMKQGIMVTANHIIDADTAELLVLEYGHKVKRVSDSDIEIGLKKEDSPEDLLPRPPIVTIMGHVDHGKTSLLDALRKTDVALREAGGITQRIGAYQVEIQDGRKITFIDTPGHAAFTEMRSRGANVTDVVVLTVAADDSVKDQTIEAINHAKAANVPIIVAINKIDKPGANPDQVRQDLLKHELVVESFGGDIMDVEISAKTGKNLDKLEETILLQADIMDLKANPNRDAEGIVVESRMEKGLGPVATVLINKGTLRVGDVFVSGTVYGRVRAIRDDRRNNLPYITPGTPGEIIGFNGSTVPGDDFVVVSDETRAREIANYRERKKREHSWVQSSKRVLDKGFSAISNDGKQKILSVIIKADVQGSAEAISTSLQRLENDEVVVKIIHSGIGEINESDVTLARASNAIILGFDVRANMHARNQIANDKIDTRYYSVIYDLIDDVKALLSGMLTPDLKENILGNAEVRKVFDISKVGRIAGCMVSDGSVRRGAKARLIRDGIVVYTGDIHSLHRGKDDVKEVRSGFECGIRLENYNDIHVNDVIECFEMEEVARQL